MKRWERLTTPYGLLAILFLSFIVVSSFHTVAFAGPCIEVTKSCEDAVAPGEPINFSGTVTNCNHRLLTNIIVTDDHSDPAIVLQVPALAGWESVDYSGSYIPQESPSTNTVTASATWAEFPDTTVSATASSTCETPTEGLCWLTAGGVKFSPLANGVLMAEYRGPKDNVGGNVYPGCSPDAGDGGSWTHIDHREKLHFHGTDITVLECGNVPGIEPGSESPVTPYNYIIFEGTGTLKGIGGNKDDYGMVCFYAIAEDRNEPGNEKSVGVNGGEDIDRYYMEVYDCLGGGGQLLLVDNGFGEPRMITGGNFQLHISSCDN
jgi:hypothetical protein